MSFWTLLAAPLNKIIDSIGNAIDKNVTNDEEKRQLKNQLKQIIADAELEAQKIELQYEQEITKRHEFDMASDDVWSKRIRPLSLVFLMFVVALLSITDGNIVVGDYVFQVKDNYIDLYQSLLLLAFGFYFGSRGIEKVASIIMTKKE